MQVVIHGTPVAAGPLTWGQHAIWAAIGRTAPNDHYFNLTRVLTPPERCRPLPAADALDRLATALSRHPTLRTRIVADSAAGSGAPARGADRPEASALDLRAVPTGPVVSGEPVRQQILAEVRVAVHTVEAADEPDADRAAESLAAALASTAFAYGTEPPVRVGLVLVGGAVARVVLALCHLATDGLGADILLRDVRLALLGRTGPPPGDPLAVAAEEASAPGRARSDAVIGTWTAAYRALPPSMFTTERAEPQPVRWWVGRLTSPALGLASAALAARHRTSVSSVLLAATAALVAADGGGDRAAVLTIVGNRFDPARRDLVATLSQEGLFTLDTAAEDFAGLLRPAWRESLRAYRSGSYDQAALDEALAAVSAERGTTVHPMCCFNDMRLVDLPPGAPPTAEQVRAARAGSVFAWAPPQPQVACRFCAHVTADGSALTYQVTGDTRFLPPTRLKSFVLALEDLVVSAVDGPAPPARLRSAAVAG
ncbi:non-ribosomal peptide synthetase condensation domain protein [Catellatospora chokoriensis]|uniref:Condensation domain-containing protein n=1 Tax=Catellatospora chokoriensis TaxID=310353 RepID=A0A8J3NSL8_9ACTN|nr:non-ribosomal peptide synthetase condensation domain protein [Catellatospora chokoriensis]GIF91165.1 hypothetical protein Cch02nite_46090 [Catellatospora chokoriensis]